MKVFCVECNLYWDSLYSTHLDRCPLCSGRRIIVDEKRHKQEIKMTKKESKKVILPFTLDILGVQSIPVKNRIEIINRYIKKHIKEAKE